MFFEMLRSSHSGLPSHEKLARRELQPGSVPSASYLHFTALVARCWVQSVNVVCPGIFTVLECSAGDFGHVEHNDNSAFVAAQETAAGKSHAE